MTIGAAAREAGVSVETIRFYQRRGLVDEPERPFGGVRRYRCEIVARIRFIKRAQALGFTLDETATLLRLDSTKACAETRHLALGKLAMIERKLADLGRMKDALAALVACCDPDEPEAGCPIIESLAKDETHQIEKGQ
jgi:MerR family mercuric resistance operon transcriptional regulator